MKNIITKALLIVLLLSTQSLLVAQTAFYEAIKICHYIEINKENSDPLVLKFFKDPFDASLTRDNIDKIIEIVKNIEVVENGKIKDDFNQITINTNSSFIPISTQSAIIDGTAKFLAERFKEEATTLYINKFKLKLDNIPELQILYPKTYSFLKGADIFNYASLGNDFKEAFEEDLKNTLGNLNNLIEKDKKLSGALKDKKLFYPFNFALSLSYRLVEGDHPVEVLDFLENKYQTTDSKDGFYNYYNIVHGVNIIQNSLQRVKTSDDSFYPQFENIWLKFSNLKELNETKEKEIFAALIYYEDPDYFSKVLNINAANASLFFNETVYPIAEILITIENYQSKEKMLVDDYLAVMDNTLKLLKQIDKMSVNKLPKSIIINKENIDLFEFIDKTIDLYKSIYSKNYGYVVTNGLYIADKVLRASGVEATKIIQITQGISKYGSFMVDVVKAENSDDVKILIQNNVTKFSYLDKRRSSFNITMSAHPGVYFGGEWLTEISESTCKPSIGITAPIGFEFMWSGKSKNESDTKNRQVIVNKNNEIKYLDEGSWSIFASFVDIGAAFNYRLNDPESQLPAELSFKQVFSPGISLNRAFKNSPLSLGLGFQYTPELREVNVGNVVTMENSYRVMLSLSWDIPMVKIYNKN